MNTGPRPKLDRWWKALDDEVCELVEKLRVLGYEHTLELEFHSDPGADRRGFLPKFREKGRVIVAPVRSFAFCVLL